MNEKNGGTKNSPKGRRRSPMRQADVPAKSLSEALRVARAIADNFAAAGARPVQLASAIGMTPASGPFRTLTSAAEAYGLTSGASRSDLIELTDLGRKIVAPTEEGAELVGKREAILRPRVVREFLTRYDGQKVPRSDIAANVISQDLGIPRDAADAAFSMIIANGEEVGVIVENKGNRYVDLQAPITIGGATIEVPTGGGAPSREDSQAEDDGTTSSSGAVDSGSHGSGPAAPPVSGMNRKIFISHGKDMKIVGQIKTILGFGDFEPIVAKERDTLAVPVPDKVINSMKECGGAIIHVSAEGTLLDAAGVEVPQVNLNVLIEIGAAMALYGRKFILLVEHGTTLPSNLQGMYEVRYSGSELDHESTMRLLSTLADFKREAS